MPRKLIAGLANALGANTATTEVAIAAAQGIPIRCRFGFFEITFQVSWKSDFLSTRKTGSSRDWSSGIGMDENGEPSLMGMNAVLFT